MVWFPDILIEYRGMSIVTALAFCFISVLYFIGWQYLQDKFRQFDDKLSTADEKLNRTNDNLEYTQSDITNLRVDLAQIQTTLENVKEMLIRLIDTQNGHRNGRH